ncbi:MAG: translocation/assembly module TamB domain-containing protein [Polyangiaceae bacterium]|nr:translocation/assembly module TamB domain-containing protein [Polyangiaceae bacterium]
MFSRGPFSNVMQPGPRKKGTDWSRLFARFVTTVFAIVGLLPIVAFAALQTRVVRDKISTEIDRALRKEGISGSLDLSLSVWPIGVRAKDIRVDSSDPNDKEPVLTAKRAFVKPKIFALLAGEVVVDTIEVEEPTVHLVIRKGEVMNLKLPKTTPSEKSGPFHAPFRSIALTDGNVDVDIDGTRIKLRQLDVDVAADDDPKRGTTMDVKARLLGATIMRERKNAAGESVYDEDEICTLSARFRVDPTALQIHRLELKGFADFDSSKTPMTCEKPSEQAIPVSIGARKLRIDLSHPSGVPSILGEVEGNVPIKLASRFVPGMPDTDGSVGLAGNLHFEPGMKLPEFEGKIEGGHIRLEQYRFADKLKLNVKVGKNGVEVSDGTIVIGDGKVHLTNVSVDPNNPSIPLKAKVDLENIDFPALMRDLGVSDHAHVAWMIHEGHITTFSGTINPLKLEGELNAKMGGFAVYDVGYDNPAKTRVIGFKEGTLQAKAVVKPGALEFHNVNIKLPTSHIDNGFVHLGFDNTLRVSVPKAVIDLKEIGPLASLELAGLAETSVEVTGVYNDPRVEADASIKNFVMSDMPLGDITAAHASLNGLVLSLTGVKAQKGKSVYEMSTAKLDFGSGAAMLMDGAIQSKSFAYKDFLSLFRMENDPRFQDIDATLAINARLHANMGGKEDRCGSGYIDIDARAHLKNIVLFDEKFEDGEIDLDYEWDDRLAGIYGARVDVRTAALRKAKASGGNYVGNILASATIDHGALHGSATLQGVPISELQTVQASLPKIAPDINGSLSGIVHVSGTVDNYTINADTDVTALDIRGAKFGSSKIHLRTDTKPSTQKPIGKTRCGNPLFAAFDEAAYLRDTSSQGSHTINGELLGDQIRLKNFALSRQQNMRISGEIELNRLGLGDLAKMKLAGSGSVSQGPSRGFVTGKIVIEEAYRNNLSLAKGSMTLNGFDFERDALRVALKSEGVTISMRDDAVTLPSLAIGLANGGLTATVRAQGSVKKLSGIPELDLHANLDPIDLGALVGIVPRIEKANGTLSGSIDLGGSAILPKISGGLEVTKGELLVRGLPAPVTDLEAKITLGATEVRLAKLQARFAGGTLNARGGIPIRGTSIGAGDIQVSLRDLTPSLQDGMAVTLDSDLRIQLAPPDFGDSTKKTLPHVTGEVLVKSFAYTRPFGFSVNELGRTKRTEVEVYDPALDSMTMDIRVRSLQPLEIRNNLADLQIKIDPAGLVISGTNQRTGLRGNLDVEKGGKFNFLSHAFSIKQGSVRFDDATRINPNFDVLAETEYKRLGAGANTASTTQNSRVAGQWRIGLHAYGDLDNIRIDKTSDPPLSDEDITLLLILGLTRAELSQFQPGDLISAATSVSGVDRAVKTAVNIIDDFRVSGGYSARTGKTVPQVTVGKRLSENVNASVTAALAEDQDLRGLIEWRLNQNVGLQLSYDKNGVSTTSVGNVGTDLSWRIEIK